MAEALINSRLSGKGIKAFSAGSDPTGRVDSSAKRLLMEKGAWKEEYHSKSLTEISEEAPFDLIITVCDNAAKNCPVPMVEGRSIHLPFEDPAGKEYRVFEETLLQIGNRLIPLVEHELLS